MSIRTEPKQATLDDLMKIDGKAELIGGRIVRMSPTGYRPNYVAGEIFASLREYVRTTGHGHAFTDGVGFAVGGLPSGRESFSPDASFHSGELPENDMHFIEGAPVFAVEVRSASNFGPAAEEELAAKRGDYFAAGTLVVWDVDPINEVVRCFHADTPDQHREFRRDDVADAEPAVPGWSVAVADLFPG